MVIKFKKDLGRRLVNPNAKSTHRRFCLAECGYCKKEFETRTDSLKTTKSCGCRHNKKKQENAENIANSTVGKRYGRLVILENFGMRETGLGNRVRKLRVKCDCGVEKDVDSKSVMRGDTQSCGCLQREGAAKRMADVGKSNKTHGMEGTRIYRIWGGMKYRCEAPNATRYEYYGGKGIDVCDEWQDFETFHTWAMENGYKEDLTIDRLDSNDDYRPGNCEWVTLAENSKRMQRTRRIKRERLK